MQMQSKNFTNKLCTHFLRHKILLKYETLNRFLRITSRIFAKLNVITDIFRLTSLKVNKTRELTKKSGLQRWRCLIEIVFVSAFLHLHFEYQWGCSWLKTNYVNAMLFQIRFFIRYAGTLQSKYLHFEFQCLSTNSWAYLLYEAVIANALPRVIATEICRRM